MGFKRRDEYESNVFVIETEFFLFKPITFLFNFISRIISFLWDVLEKGLIQPCLKFAIRPCFKYLIIPFFKHLIVRPLQRICSNITHILRRIWYPLSRPISNLLTLIDPRPRIANVWYAAANSWIFTNIGRLFNFIREQILVKIGAFVYDLSLRLIDVISQLCRATWNPFAKFFTTFIWTPFWTYVLKPGLTLIGKVLKLVWSLLSWPLKRIYHFVNATCKAWRLRNRKGIIDGEFSFDIPHADRQITTKDRGQFYILPNGKQYYIQVQNESDGPCNCRITIDGTAMGIWRLPARTKLSIERPTHSVGRFTFTQENSSIKCGRTDHKTGITTGAKVNGEVEVSFIPVKPAPFRNRSYRHKGKAFRVSRGVRRRYRAGGDHARHESTDEDQDGFGPGGGEIDQLQTVAHILEDSVDQVLMRGESLDSLRQRSRSSSRSSSPSYHLGSLSDTKEREEGFHDGSGLSDQEDDVDIDDETVSGATALEGTSEQRLSSARKMIEEKDREVILKAILILDKQYCHQLEVQKLLNDPSVLGSKATTNLIAEYLYTHSLLDLY